MAKIHHEFDSNLESASEQLEAFVHNEGLDDLARLYLPEGEELPILTHERLAALQELATGYWDYRKGAERQEVDWNDENVDTEGSEQWEAIFDAAAKLGLVESSKPVNRHPQHLVVLGGANRSPLDRLRYGLSMVDDFEHVAYLGSSRTISDAEQQKAADYAPGAITEFDLGCGAFETLLGAVMTDEVTIERDGDIWGMRLYEFEWEGKKRTGFVLSTPQYIGEKRATTYDNYRFFADRAELAEHPDQSVVAVTNAFFTKFQHLTAIQELTLAHGTPIETIGFEADYYDKSIKRKPSQLLQETKSAIDAAVRLEQALTNQ